MSEAECVTRRRDDAQKISVTHKKNKKEKSTTPRRREKIFSDTKKIRFFFLLCQKTKLSYTKKMDDALCIKYQII